MTARITEIVFDCHDTNRMAEFWCAVLGYRETDRDETDVCIAGAPNAPVIILQKVPEDKVAKNRVHLDVNAVNGDQMAEVARIESLGGRRIDIGQGETRWVVMADPEGNEFCVLTKSVQPEPEPFLATPDLA